MSKWLPPILTISLFLYLCPPKLSLAQTELTVTIDVGDTILTLSGKTSPEATVTVVENGVVVGTTTADSQGNFSKSLLAQTAGVHSMGIYSTDKNGMTTSTVNYSVSLTAFMETTLSNIILPPTVSLAGTEITKGDTLEISGLSVPSSTITLFISSTTTTKSVTSSSNGFWNYSYATGDLETGDHSLYAKTITSAGYQSEASQTMSFKVNPAPTVTPAPAATSTPVPVTTVSPTPSPIPTPGIPAIVAFFDIDGSGRIEVAELFEAIKAWVSEWREKPPEGGKCDLNGDGKCNLIDFSILLYYVGR